MQQGRFLCPRTFEDRNRRGYRVSFRISEEGTWDHRFHDCAGREVDPEDLWLAHGDYRFIQSCCDSAVGRPLQPIAGPMVLARGGAGAGQLSPVS